MKIVQIPLDQITIPDYRQRSDLGDLNELSESIQRVGQLQPIIITGENVLVAGERRLKAHQLLGYKTISAHYIEDMDSEARQMVELEENVRRKDLTWQEYTEAVATFHKLKMETDAEWTTVKTGEKVGVTSSIVNYRLQVAKALEANDEDVTAATSFRQAVNILNRRFQRKHATEMSKLIEVDTPIGDIADVLPTAEDGEEEETTAPAPSVMPFSIYNHNFVEVAATPQNPKFNFIHCDFPYGINYNTSAQGRSQVHKTYNDSEDVYFTLLEAFCTNLNKFCSVSAHLMFWYSRKHEIKTIEMLTAAGWVIDPFPLIWHKSDGRGILPDPERGPRRVYETCLFGYRGDRRIVKAVNNCYSAPTASNKLHSSQKPEPVLRHFMSMMVDENTIMLDPTCGSGTALASAITLGAKSVVGMDIDEEYCQTAEAVARRVVTMERLSNGRK